MADRIRIEARTSSRRTACSKLVTTRDRKSTRLNSSHGQISYAVFCLKKKKQHHPYDGEHQDQSRQDTHPGIIARVPKRADASAPHPLCEREPPFATRDIVSSSPCRS